MCARSRVSGGDEAALALAVIRPDVLHADERRLGPPQVAPERDARQPLAVPAHLPEEVVRGEEGEVPAEVAVPTNEVDAPDPPVHIPRVAPAVAVLVVEVVRLPRVRREDDGDAVRAEHTRPND